MTSQEKAGPVLSGHEFVVVECRIVGNPEWGYETSRWAHKRLPSLYEAKRWGLRHFDHDDDFNIAVVEDGNRLVRWTWMGEDLEHDIDVLAIIARSLQWRLSDHPVLASEQDNTDSPPLCDACGHPADRHDFAGGCGVTVTATTFCPCKVSFASTPANTDSAVPS